MDHYEPFFQSKDENIKEKLRRLYSFSSTPNPFVILLVTGADKIRLYKKNHIGPFGPEEEEALKKLENPKERLRAEIAWLADSTHEEWAWINEKLRNNCLSEQVDLSLPPLSQLNLALLNLEKSTGQSLNKKLIRAICYSKIFSSTECVISIYQNIQKSRAVAGVPLIGSLQTFIHEVRRYSEVVYARIFAAISQQLPEEIAAILTVAETINRRTKHNNELLKTLLKFYEQTIRDSLTFSAKDIEKILNKESFGSGEYAALADDIRMKLKRWQLFIEPISLASQDHSSDFKDPALELLRIFRQKEFELVINNEFRGAIFLTKLLLETFKSNRKIREETQESCDLITQLAAVSDGEVHE